MPLRAYDQVRFRKGLPWDGEAMALAQSVLQLAEAAASMSGPSGTEGPLQILQDSVRKILGASPELVAQPAQASQASEAVAQETDPSADEEAAAAAARSSSDLGLRQLRIVG
jgi:hypothetical protein